MDVLARKATLKDIDKLIRLLGFLFEQEEEFQADSTLQSKGLSLIINQPDKGVILTLEREGKLIGMVNLLFTISTALGEEVVILEDMVVHPDYRGQGYGKQLLNTAIDFCENKGYKRITLLTDNDNVRAQGFYRLLGFSPSSMVVYRKGL